MVLRSDEPLKAKEERVWKDVARFPFVGPRLLDEDLQRGANISLSEYAVLGHLSEAETSHLRVSELADLADLADLSGSHMTRIIGELTKDCSVVKNRNPDDGRGIDVHITELGLNRLRDAYRVPRRVRWPPTRVSNEYSNA